MSFSIFKGNWLVNSIFWIVLLVIPLFSWLSSEGNILDYFIYTVPQGQFLYVISKLLGLYGLTFLWLHMSYALLRHSFFNVYLVPWSIKRHRNTAIFALVLIVLHLGLFVMAVSLRKELVSFDLLIPNFSHGYYKSLLSFGAIGFWLILFVALTGRLLALTKKNEWTLRWLHRLSFVCFTLVYFHGLGVGSETKSGILFLFYLFMGGSLLVFILLRIFKPMLPRFLNN